MKPEKEEQGLGSVRVYPLSQDVDMILIFLTFMSIVKRENVEDAMGWNVQMGARSHQPLNTGNGQMGRADNLCLKTPVALRKDAPKVIPKENYTVSEIGMYKDTICT